MEGTFEQGCLAGTGRADQVQDKNSFFLEQGAVKTGQTVVFTQNVFFDGDLSPLSGFSVMMVMMFAFVVVFAGMVVAVFVAMIVAVMMVVVVIVVVIGRGTSAGCAHGGLLKCCLLAGRFFCPKQDLDQVIRFLRLMQYQLREDCIYISPNCSWCNLAYAPPARMSSSCVPSSTLIPCWIVTIRSASRMVESRWAMTSEVRPSIIPLIPS